MNKLQLQELIVEPVMREIPHGYSEEAVTAFMMCVAHESKCGTYIKQINGPALGLPQIEPLTHNETWKHGDSIWDNAYRIGLINHYEFESKLHPNPNRLLYDLRYNVFMFRQRMFMKKGAIPKDLHGISAYLKTHWNSVHGKAHYGSYYDDYINWK